MTTWNPRANELFLAARELRSPAERGEFLDRACAGDADLRAEVEALLEAGDCAGDFLQSPAPAVTVDHQSLVERPGAVVGPYKLLEQIGEGGFGVVFMAEQTRPVRRKVALKVLKPGMDTRQVVARFEAERQALALMDHPNIARVFDGGATDSGRPYFVMELVKGLPITEFCDRNHLTPRQRLELFLPVCAAVQHAHQKGIIHRDLKPANVLVTVHDTVPVVKVIDFGVAKALGQELTDKTLFTGFAQMIGTPLYMSPEQAGQSGLDVDTRTDIYALGVLLYELLTGTTPFTRERFRKAAFDEILRVIREEEPPRPSTRLSDSGEALASISAQRHMEPARLTKLVRGELDWIVMKTLEKDRNRRYETVNGFAADVQRFLNDEAVTACPPSSIYRLGKFARRNKGLLTSIAVVFLALVIGTAAATWQAVQTRKAERLAARRLDSESIALRAATSARDSAVRERIRAEQAGRSLEWQLYLSRVNQAQAEWTANHIELAEKLLEACPQHLRGWEWEYVRGQCHQELQTFRSGTQGVNAVALSPDGQLLAAGSGPFESWVRSPGDLVVRELATGREVLSRHGLAEGIRGIAFSPDSRLVAATNARDLTVWDLATGRETLRLTEAGENRALGVSFSPDGRMLLVGFGNYNFPDVGYARVLDVTTGREVGPRIAGHPGGVWHVAYSPDGLDVALTSSGIVEVWNLADRKPVLTLRGHVGYVYGVAFSPDGKSLATCGHDRTVRLWARSDGAEIRTFRGHEGFVRGVAFSPDGTRLVTAGEDKAVKLWDVSSDRELATFHGHKHFIHCVAFGPDGIRIVTGSQDRTTKVWAAVTGLQPRFRLGCEVVGVAFGPDGRTVASAIDDAFGEPRVEARDVVTGEVRQRLKGLYAPDIAYSPDGRWLIWGGPAGIGLWDVKEGRMGPALTRVIPQSRGLAYRSADHMVLAACSDGVVRAWNLETGREDESKRFPIVPPKEPSWSAAPPGCATFSRDGRRLAVADADRSVRVYDADTGRELFSLRGHQHPVLAIAFSPNGRRIVTSGGDPLRGLAELKCWDATTGRELDTPAGPSETILCLEFSPDGRRLATASDRMIKIWDAERLEEVLTLRGHTAYVVSLAFSPDGHRLASGSIDLDMRLWESDPPAADVILRRASLIQQEQGVTRSKDRANERSNSSP